MICDHSWFISANDDSCGFSVDWRKCFFLSLSDIFSFCSQTKKEEKKRPEKRAVYLISWECAHVGKKER